MRRPYLYEEGGDGKQRIQFKGQRIGKYVNEQGALIFGTAITIRILHFVSYSCFEIRPQNILVPVNSLEEI